MLPLAGSEHVTLWDIHSYVIDWVPWIATDGYSYCYRRVPIIGYSRSVTKGETLTACELQHSTQSIEYPDNCLLSLQPPWQLLCTLATMHTQVRLDAKRLRKAKAAVKQAAADRLVACRGYVPAGAPDPQPKQVLSEAEIGQNRCACVHRHASIMLPSQCCCRNSCCHA